MAFHDLEVASGFEFSSRRVGSAYFTVLMKQITFDDEQVELIHRTSGSA